VVAAIFHIIEFQGESRSDFGPSRHFAAAQQPRRFRGEADIGSMRHVTDFTQTKNSIWAKHGQYQMTDLVMQKTDRKSVRFQFKFVDEATAPGTFEGYGSVFGNEDDGGDLILTGAFTGVLARHAAKGTMPKMLLNHGSMGGGFFGGNDPLADLPIGKWQSLSEDSYGLASKGRLFNLDTESGKRIYGAMKEGELDGQSIGYTVGEFTRGTKPNEPRRTIKTIKELPEISLVTFPMNELARTGAVKAADIRTVRDFEDALRDVLGFSHAAAKSIALRGFKAANDQPSRLDDFIASLRDVRRQI
jgi:HK97 family phage prohead protease